METNDPGRSPDPTAGHHPGPVPGSPSRPASVGGRRLLTAGRAPLLAAALVLVAGAACSNGGDGDDRALTESINSSQPEGEGGSDDAATGGEGDESGAGSGSGSDEVLGTTRAQLDADDDRTASIRVDVTRLERNGELVELALLFTNEVEPQSGDAEPPSFSLDGRLADGNRYDVSGIGLVDGEEQMLYLPAFDSEGVCLCTFTGSGGSTRIAAGESLTIEATIGGLPENVRQVDVRLPSFPAITGVAIQ